MKLFTYSLFGLLSLGVFAQETTLEQFLPIVIEGKEAFMSTKTGEYTYLEHAKTDATQLKTTASGVVYSNISIYTVLKGETLAAVAKKNEVSVDEIKRHNKDITSKLAVGTEIKIVKNLLIKSSSPVIGTSGESRILAKLRPGESPGQFAAPPTVAEVENQVIETKKTQEKATAKVYNAEMSVKNPIFGLNKPETKNKLESQQDKSIENLSEAINREVSEVKTNSKKETKTEKLARLKAEMEALETELEVAPVSKQITTVKTKETESGRKVTTFNKNLKTTDTLVDKTEQVITSVSKTEKIVDASKIEKIETKNNLDLESSSNANKTINHRVIKGDTLSSIARQYDMTLKALILLNDLKSDNLKIGQKLKVNPKK